jgi:hypothetical protein
MFSEAGGEVGGVRDELTCVPSSMHNPNPQSAAIMLLSFSRSLE